MLIFIILCSIISLIFSLASFVLSEKNPYTDKVSTYECGFNPLHVPGEPFSIKFFLVGVLFLVFDVEISLLLPWSATSNALGLYEQLIVFLFILILTVGLIYEWSKGGLEWE